MRLDQHLATHHLAPTRSQAQLLIREGKVLVNGDIVIKTGHEVDDEDRIELLQTHLFVGRGAQKLLAALEAFDLDAKGKIAADVGASTGGFTQVLLERGVEKVYALDVGHDQLAASLKTDSRVVNLEGINIRNGIELPEKVDFVVADLSFISLRLVLEPIRHLAKDNADFILLFKPQFEVGKEKLGKNGVVKNERVSKQVLDDFFSWCRSGGWQVQGVLDSPIEGKEGNKEVLLWFKNKNLSPLEGRFLKSSF